MLKVFKKALFFIVAACLAVTCLVTAACEELPPEGPHGNPSEIGYVVTVKYPDGTTVKGSDAGGRLFVNVALSDGDGNIIEGTATPLNESGIANIDYKVPGVYGIEVVNCPAGYLYTQKIKTTANEAYCEVNLTMKPYTDYTVNVLLDGSGVADIGVKFVKGSSTVATATTDANGVATLANVPTGVYAVELENLPKGCYYAKTNTTISGVPVDVVLRSTTVLEFTDDTKCEGAALKEWTDKLNGVLINRIDVEAEHHLFTAEIGEGKEVFFSITTGDVRGRYVILVKDNTNYITRFYGTDLSQYDPSMTISYEEEHGNANNRQEMYIYANSTYYFSFASLDGQAESVQFLIELPVPEPTDVTYSETGTYAVDFEMNTAILRFCPTVSGVYSVFSDSSEYDLKLVSYSPATLRPNAAPDDDNEQGDYPDGYLGDDNSGEGNNFLFKETFTAGELGATRIYYLIIKDSEVHYPVQVNVTIRRDGDVVEKEVERINITSSETQKYEVESGATFHWMPTDGSLPTKEIDGKWYVTVDGHDLPLLVAINKTLENNPYSLATWQYFGEVEYNPEAPVIQNHNLTVREETQSKIIYRDYTSFIETYSKLTNSDGVYHVNGELKAFLDACGENSWANLIGITDNPVKPAQPWLICCGYYD